MLKLFHIWLVGGTSNWFLRDFYDSLNFLRLPYFLERKDVLGSPYTLPASAISSKSPDSYEWRMKFRNQDTRSRYAALSVTRPKKCTYIYAHTHTHTICI